MIDPALAHDACGQPAARPALTELPAGAGVSLKYAHLPDILETRPQVAFFEVHAENYMGAGGPPHHFLERVRADYPLSIHGVAASLGGAEPPDPAHLARLRALVRRYEPESFSEHLAWSTHEGVYLADLLPLPYDEVSLRRVSDHVAQLQDALQCRALIENPSTYAAFTSSTMEEIDFLTALAARTGCGLLLDVNNVHVSCVNHHLDARAYIDRFPMHLVGEVHLAGFARDVDAAGAELLIDAHGSAVDPEVWRLYERALARSGPVPTLVEWDNDVPAFAVLAGEGARAGAAIAAVPPREAMEAAQ